jgi:CRISPR-associated protein Cas1
LAGSVTDLDNLLRAWETVRANDAASGLPSPGVAAFGRGVVERLTKLRAELLDGTYRPADLTRVDIPKANGDVRVLAVPAVADRVVERAILQELAPVIDPYLSPLSLAYRPGLGVSDAVQLVVEARAEGASWVLHADFFDCFDSLDHEFLLAELRAHVDDPWLNAILGMLLGRPLRRTGHIQERRRGAPQGAPLSPLLANLALHRFDMGMLRRELRVIRYADDFVVPAPTARAALDAAEVAGEVASSIKLRLNSDKTKITSYKEGFSFVGVEIDDRFPRLMPKDLERPLKKTLYVHRPDVALGSRRGQLRARRCGKDVLTLPLTQVAQIVTFGPVSISPWLRSEALYRGIDIVHLSGRGRYLGRLEAPLSVDTDLQRRHYLASEESAMRLRVARRFVEAKIANQRALLLRRARRALPELASIADSLEALRRRTASAGSLNALFGMEGSASHAYFIALRHLLPEDLGFERRIKRSPQDPVNAALSFGYSILTAAAAGACRVAGLDPYVGFLHSRRQGKPSLALDLMEEFRPLIVDTVVVECFRRGTLERAGFRREQGRLLLNDRAREAFLACLEERFLTRFAHTPSRSRTSYRRALILQARQIAQLVAGVREDYEPVRWR